MNHSTLEEFLLQGFEEPLLPSLQENLLSLDFSSSMAYTFPITSSYATHAANNEFSSASSAPTLSSSFAASMTPIISSESSTTSTEDPSKIPEREVQRRAKQVVASQEYRKRKRKRLEDLENTVADLTQKLADAKKEAAQVRNTAPDTTMAPSAEFKQTTLESRRIVLFIKAALDHQSCESHLQYLLSLFWSNAELVLISGEKTMHEIFNGFLLRRITIYGFGLTSSEPAMFRLIPAAPWWPDFCRHAGLTQDQIDAVEIIKDTTQQTGMVLFQERLKLFNDMELIFSEMDSQYSPHRVCYDAPAQPAHANASASASASATPAAVSSAATGTQAIPAALAEPWTPVVMTANLMKSNYSSQLRMILSAHKQIGSLLTRRQHAMMVTRAYSGGGQSMPYENVLSLWKLMSRCQTL